MLGAVEDKKNTSPFDIWISMCGQIFIRVFYFSSCKFVLISIYSGTI